MSKPTIMTFYEERRRSVVRLLVCFIGHGKADCLGCDDLMQRIGEINPNGVYTGSQPDYNQRLAAAVNEVPRRIVYCDVNMSQSR